MDPREARRVEQLFVRAVLGPFVAMGVLTAGLVLGRAEEN
jgi:hypothetical protein